MFTSLTVAALCHEQSKRGGSRSPVPSIEIPVNRTSWLLPRSGRRNSRTSLIGNPLPTKHPIEAAAFGHDFCAVPMGADRYGRFMLSRGRHVPVVLIKSGRAQIGIYGPQKSVEFDPAAAAAAVRVAKTRRASVRTVH